MCLIVVVVKAAVLANSHAIIVAHNHPAGSLTPSDEDIDVTRTLIKAGQLMGVNVIDHIIVSSNGLCSLRETRGYLWPVCGNLNVGQFREKRSRKRGRFARAI
jgi:DNA repair protein RadC